MTLLIGVIALLVLPLALGPCILCRDGWRSSSPGGQVHARGTAELIQTSRAGSRQNLAASSTPWCHLTVEARKQFHYVLNRLREVY